MFIEVTGRKDGDKLLVSVGVIKSVASDDNGSYIETYYDEKHGSRGVFVRESYDEIKAKLNDLVGVK